MARRRAAVAAIAALALVCLPASAAGSSALAYGALSDRYLAVWERDGLHARVLDGAGAWASGPITLDGRPARAPDVAYDPVTNEFLVTWERGGAVRAARLGAYGELLGERRISARGAMAADPRVAAGEDGGYLVVWERGGAIAGQPLDPLGLELGPDLELARIASASCVAGPLSACNPDVAAGAGGYLVAWHDDVPADDYEDEVFARRLTARGRRAGPRTQVSFAGYDPADAIFTQATNPVVAWDPYARDFLVAWEGFSAQPRGREQEVVAQRVWPGRGLAGENVRVSQAPGGPLEVAPSDVELSAGGGFAAVWEERIGQGAGTAVAGAELGAPAAFRQAGAQNAALAYSEARREHLVLWEDGDGGVRAGPLPGDPFGAG